jgi:hypothetical protein
VRRTFFILGLVLLSATAAPSKELCQVAVVTPRLPLQPVEVVASTAAELSSQKCAPGVVLRMSATAKDAGDEYSDVHGDDLLQGSRVTAMHDTAARFCDFTKHIMATLHLPGFHLTCVLR